MTGSSSMGRPVEERAVCLGLGVAAVTESWGTRTSTRKPKGWSWLEKRGNHRL
jgi:hypothetical protein